jgi:hypothetical protein
MMLAISMLLLAFGAVHLLRSGWLVTRNLPQRNEDMVFF